ncbi:MAG: hypothetical protein WC205_16920 [Opitutaceae bacterium]|jgi:hypothetical protein
MAWITLTEADALRTVNAKLLTALRTKALADGQADPLVETLGETIDEVRGSVGACKTNTLGPDGTIPQKLKGAALAIFAVKMLGRLDIEPEKAKLLLFESAEKKLAAAAACKFDIEEPVTPTEEKSSGARLPRITPRCRQFTREDQDGS